MIQYTGVMF